MANKTNLKFQVINKGVLIYNFDDHARRYFHEKTVREYLDFKPFLEVQAASSISQEKIA